MSIKTALFNALVVTARDSLVSLSIVLSIYPVLKAAKENKGWTILLWISLSTVLLGTAISILGI